MKESVNETVKESVNEAERREWIKFILWLFEFVMWELIRSIFLLGATVDG